jgi:hypothetical protein
MTKKTYDPDVMPSDPEELLPWMEATAAEHQRRRFEEEPFGATIVSMEEYEALVAAGFFDREVGWFYGDRPPPPLSPELAAVIDRLRREDRGVPAAILDRWLGRGSR